MVKCAICGPVDKFGLKVYRFPVPGTRYCNTVRSAAWAKYAFPEKDWYDTKFQQSIYSRNLMLCTRHFSRDQFSDLEAQRLHRDSTPNVEWDKIQQGIETKRKNELLENTQFQLQDIKRLPVNSDAHITDPTQVEVPLEPVALEEEDENEILTPFAGKVEIIDNNISEQDSEIHDKETQPSNDSYNNVLSATELPLPRNKKYLYDYLHQPNVCRLCWSEQTCDLIEIDDDLAANILNCVNVDVSTLEPKKICSECHSKITSFLDFKQNCQEGDLKLRYILNEGPSKDYVIEICDPEEETKELDPFVNFDVLDEAIEISCCDSEEDLDSSPEIEMSDDPNGTTNNFEDAKVRPARTRPGDVTSWKTIVSPKSPNGITNNFEDAKVRPTRKRPGEVTSWKTIISPKKYRKTSIMISITDDHRSKIKLTENKIERKEINIINNNINSYLHCLATIPKINKKSKHDSGHIEMRSNVNNKLKHNDPYNENSYLLNTYMKKLTER